MYRELADWWTLLSPVSEYVEEAGLFHEVLRTRAPQAKTLLELGAGGGNNAFHLKAHYQMTLVDLSDDMLRQSRRINGELTHHVGDMRDVRLDERFDAVFIHDAISYMTTREDLLRAMQTARAHLLPGGIAMFVPDETKERYRDSTDCGGVDEGKRGFRYLEWFWDPDPDDEKALADYAFLIRDDDGQTRAVHDRHEHGLFPRQVWLDTVERAGFARAEIVAVEHSDVEGHIEIFVGHT